MLSYDDIVYQGTETISILAAGLLNNPRWFLNNPQPICLPGPF